MRRRILGLIAAALGSAAALAQSPAPQQLSADQKAYIVYHECMMHAAMAASHTDAKDEAIFGIAKAQCAPTRARVVAGQEGNRDLLAALDAADVEKEAHFPVWIKGVRERRKAFDTPVNPPTAAH